MIKTQAQYQDYPAGAAFKVLGAETQARPVIFNSPHSGSDYPQRFLDMSRLSPETIRLSEDMYVDELFSRTPELGAVLQKAHFPRSYLDVNREPYELDAAMFAQPLPAFVNAKSLRVEGGLGTIAKIVAENQSIYHGKLDLEDALTRIEHIYQPYHDSLRRLIARTRAQFGIALLIDCHSMPSQAHGASQHGQAPRADIIIGDRYGTSCTHAITEVALTILHQAGFHVTKNKPYAGGFITQHYGRPQNNLHALQIEINRKLYMDENRLEKHEGFEILQKALTAFVDTLMNHPVLIPNHTHSTNSLAAE